MYKPPKFPYSYFLKALEIHLRVLFPSESKKTTARKKGNQTIKARYTWLF